MARSIGKSEPAMIWRARYFSINISVNIILVGFTCSLYVDVDVVVVGSWKLEVGSWQLRRKWQKCWLHPAIELISERKVERESQR